MRFKDDREPEDDEKTSIKGRGNDRMGLWLRDRKEALKSNEEEICSGLAPRFRAGACAAPLRRRPERSQPHLSNAPGATAAHRLAPKETC